MLETHFSVGEQDVEGPEGFFLAQVHQQHAGERAHSLAVADLAVVHAVSDQHVEQLLLLQVVALAEENVLAELPIDIRVDLPRFRSVVARQLQHSLVLVLVVLIGHHRAQVQQLRPHHIAHLVGDSFVDPLRQLLLRRLRLPLAEHLDPLLLALRQHLQPLLNRLLVILRRRKFLIMNESVATKTNANS